MVGHTYSAAVTPNRITLASNSSAKWGGAVGVVWGNISKVCVCACARCVCDGVCVCAGRKEPVPFEMKDDHMGLGRWTLEVIPPLPPLPSPFTPPPQLELAQDATEKRKLLEAEKEVTPDLIEKYKVQYFNHYMCINTTASPLLYLPLHHYDIVPLLCMYDIIMTSPGAGGEGALDGGDADLYASLLLLRAV